MLTPLQFLQLLRNCHPDMARVGLFVKCLRVHLILKAVFPAAKPLYDGNHIVTEINGKYYDITGQVGCTPNHKEISQEELDKYLSWDVRGDAEELNYQKYKDRTIKI